MPETIKIEEIMTKKYKWIEEQESLGKALSCFKQSCDVLLVKDNDQHYLGILTERMILEQQIYRKISNKRSFARVYKQNSWAMTDIKALT